MSRSVTLKPYPCHTRTSLSALSHPLPTPILLHFQSRTALFVPPTAPHPHATHASGLVGCVRPPTTHTGRPCEPAATHFRTPWPHHKIADYLPAPLPLQGCGCPGSCTACTRSSSSTSCIHIGLQLALCGSLGVGPSHLRLRLSLSFGFDAPWQPSPAPWASARPSAQPSAYGPLEPAAASSPSNERWLLPAAPRSFPSPTRRRATSTRLGFSGAKSFQWHACTGVARSARRSWAQAHSQHDHKGHAGSCLHSASSRDLPRSCTPFCGTLRSPSGTSHWSVAAAWARRTSAGQGARPGAEAAASDKALGCASHACRAK